jgi:histone H3/H4
MAITKKQARNLLKSVEIDNLEICASEGRRTLTKADVEAQNPE